MAIDPNIKQKAENIRLKKKGREVRESLAAGLEAMSEDVVSTVARQGNVESQFQEVIDNTTGKDVISAPELIAARNGEVNLKARLDKEQQQVNAQLAQTGKHLNNFTQKWLNGNDFGLNGDYKNAEVNNHDALHNMFMTLYNDPFFDYDLFRDNRISKYNIEIPRGVYRIGSANIGDVGGSYRISNIEIEGNNSIFIADGFAGDLFRFDDRLMEIDFYNIRFHSTDDGNLRRFLLAISDGGTQSIRFHNCTFSGKWDYGIYLEGTNNNSEMLFETCGFSGKWKSFLMIPDEKGSDQFLNYWFTNCKYHSSSTWITAKRGGHFVLDHCDVSIYQPTELTYLFDLGRQFGDGAYGVQTFIDRGTRYELKTANAKVIKCHWKQAQVIFDGSDFTSSTHIDVDRRDTFYFITSYGDASPFYVFENCKILGDFKMQAVNDTNADLFIKNSTIFNSDGTGKYKSVDDFFTFEHELPNVRFRVVLEEVRFERFSYSKTIEASELNEVYYQTNIHKKNNAYGKFPLSWRKKISSKTIIKAITMIGKADTTDGWNHKIGIRSDVATVTSVVSNKIGVDNIKDFIIGNKIAPKYRPSTIYTITGIDVSNKTITLNENYIGSTGDTISFALSEIDFRPLSGGKMTRSDVIYTVEKDLYAAYYGSNTSATDVALDVLIETYE